jgi:hypothetical protein
MPKVIIKDDGINRAYYRANDRGITWTAFPQDATWLSSQKAVTTALGKIRHRSPNDLPMLCVGEVNVIVNVVAPNVKAYLTPKLKEGWVNLIDPVDLVRHKDKLRELDVQ